MTKISDRISMRDREIGDNPPILNSGYNLNANRTIENDHHADEKTVQPVGASEQKPVRRSEERSSWVTATHHSEDRSQRTTTTHQAEEKAPHCFDEGCSDCRGSDSQRRIIHTPKRGG
jgi:hypothetical protein